MDNKAGSENPIVRKNENILGPSVSHPLIRFKSADEIISQTLNGRQEVLSNIHNGPIEIIECSEDEKWLITGSWIELKLWKNLNGFKVVSALTIDISQYLHFDPYLKSYFLTPDYKTIVFCSIKSDRIHCLIVDIENGEINSSDHSIENIISIKKFPLVYTELKLNWQNFNLSKSFKWFQPSEMPNESTLQLAITPDNDVAVNIRRYDQKEIWVKDKCESEISDFKKMLYFGFSETGQYLLGIERGEQLDFYKNKKRCLWAIPVSNESIEDNSCIHATAFNIGSFHSCRSINHHIVGYFSDYSGSLAKIRNIYPFFEEMSYDQYKLPEKEKLVVSSSYDYFKLNNLGMDLILSFGTILRFNGLPWSETFFVTISDIKKYPYKIGSCGSFFYDESSEESVKIYNLKGEHIENLPWAYKTYDPSTFNELIRFKNGYLNLGNFHIRHYPGMRYLRLNRFHKDSIIISSLLNNRINIINMNQYRIVNFENKTSCFFNNSSNYTQILPFDNKTFCGRTLKFVENVHERIKDNQIENVLIDNSVIIFSPETIYGNDIGRGVSWECQLPKVKSPSILNRYSFCQNSKVIMTQNSFIDIKTGQVLAHYYLVGKNSIDNDLIIVTTPDENSDIWFTSSNTENDEGYLSFIKSRVGYQGDTFESLNPATVQRMCNHAAVYARLQGLEYYNNYLRKNSNNQFVTGTNKRLTGEKAKLTGNCNSIEGTEESSSPR